MRFAGHPIIGTSWVLMNKVFKHQPNEIELKVPIGGIQVSQSKDLVWLKAAQPDFLDVFMKEDFASFSNLSVTDFDNRFEVQEVTTGSAFVIVPLKNKETLNAVKLDKDKTAEWLKAKCKTEHKALYFFSLENEILDTRMLCIENNQLIEDAATGSASTCLQAFLLKYHSTEIKMVNNQGEYINRKSQIFFEGKREENLFDINIGGESQFVAQGEWEVG
jgi:trans-2,3-dihydro-3-hydroxyanthranilate isomerase